MLGGSKPTARFSHRLWISIARKKNRTSFCHLEGSTIPWESWFTVEFPILKAPDAAQLLGGSKHIPIVTAWISPLWSPKPHHSSWLYVHILTSSVVFPPRNHSLKRRLALLRETPFSMEIYDGFSWWFSGDFWVLWWHLLVARLIIAKRCLYQNVPIP